jgi:hypothetical protein
MPVAPKDITELLLAWNQGDEQALQELMPLVQYELHRLAHRYMGGERLNHTLQTTALVMKPTCVWWTPAVFAGKIERTSSPCPHN